MGRQVLNVSAAMLTIVLLALGVGRALPRNEQLLFSSSTNWQAETWGVYLMDVDRGVAQRLLTSRTDTAPGFPIVWSPSGDQIAFLSNGKDLQTYLVNSDGQNLRRLTGVATEDEYNAAWSPDGRHLAFIGERDGKRDVYIASADGSNPRNLTLNSEGFRSLTWSPDSRHLALESMVLADVDIYTLDIETGVLSDVSNSPGNDIRPAWSPDGTQIAFMSSRNSGSSGNTRYDLYLMNRDGTNLRRSTYNLLADTIWKADWSPDGQHIVFGSTSWAGGPDIFVTDAHDGTVQNVTSNSARDGSPVWSPDGKQLAFESQRNGYWQIELISLDGRERRQITSAAQDSRHPVWSPDGRHIVYISNPAFNWDLYMVDLWGLDTMRVTYSHLIDFSPVWRP